MTDQTPAAGYGMDNAGPAEVRAACRELLPGAQIRRHLLWRYSLVWRRPS